MKFLKHIIQFIIAFGIFFSSATYFPQNLKHNKYDSIILNKPREMGKNNVSREKIIQWNLEMLKKMKEEDYKKGIIWVYTNLSDEYLNINKPDEALKYLNIAENLSEKYSTDYFTIASIFQEYSRIYYASNLHKIALKHNSKAIYYGKNIENIYEKKKFLQYAYAARGTFYYNIENKDSAIVYIKKSNQIYESPGIISTIANHYLDFSPNQDSARKYLDQALQIIKKNYRKIDAYEISVAYFYYGIYFIREENYSNAAIYLEKSLFYNKTENNKELLQNIYKSLALCYKKLGDKEREKESLENLIKTTDTINIAQTKTLELSLKKAEEKKNEEKKSLKKIALLCGACILFISLLLISYFYYQNKKKKKLIIESKKIISQKEDKTKILEKRIAESHEALILLAKNNDIGFLSKFQELYPLFTKKLLEINPSLTQSDLTFCALIWLGFSSKEIALYTFTQHRSIQTKKNRLRKKLNISSDIDLYHFLRQIIEENSTDSI